MPLSSTGAETRTCFGQNLGSGKEDDEASFSAGLVLEDVIVRGALLLSGLVKKLPIAVIRRKNPRRKRHPCRLGCTQDVSGWS